ncbi:MAG: hypothetical protein U1E13_06150, partial [Methylophilaceae bacterium]|nr:hypothetical protein [Methylophilaceae bacterium]
MASRTRCPDISVHSSLRSSNDGSEAAGKDVRSTTPHRWRSPASNDIPGVNGSPIENIPEHREAPGVPR